MRSLFMDRYEAWDPAGKSHHGHAFNTAILREVERLLPENIACSAETGCGKSTIMFSNISANHTAFALDDRDFDGGSSVDFFTACPLSVPQKVTFIFGPTQKTLPVYDAHQPYDVVLIDGPHGYPFPELEYMFFYPHIKKGGILIIDDVHIPTIGRLADFIKEDEMFAPVALIGETALFRRTEAEIFDPYGDGWWLQRYNRRRIPATFDFSLDDGPVQDYFSERNRQNRNNGRG